MMLVYLLLPMIAGALVGWAVSRAIVSGAVALGLWASLFLVPAVTIVPPVFLLPPVFGGAVGATTLTLWLYLRPGSGAGARAAVAAVAALGASFGLIFNAYTLFGA